MINYINFNIFIFRLYYKISNFKKIVKIITNNLRIKNEYKIICHQNQQLKEY